MIAFCFSEYTCDAEVQLKTNEKRKIPEDALNYKFLDIDATDMLSKLFGTEVYAAATTYKEQIKLIVDSLRQNNLTCSYETIASIFGITKGALFNLNKRSCTQSYKVGRPSVLEDSEKDAVLQYILNCFNDDHPPTYAELIDYFQPFSGKILIVDTLHKLLKSWSSMKTVDGKPMESERVHCNPEEIDTFYNLLQFALDGVPAAFVCNIGESGFQDWVGSRTEKVVAPSVILKNILIYLLIKIQKDQHCSLQLLPMVIHLSQW